MRVRKKIRWTGMCLCTFLWSMVTTASGQGTFTWTGPGGGWYTNSDKWTLTAGTGTAPPGIGDTAYFNVLSSGGYSVSFVGTTFSDFVQISNGLVVFKSLLGGTYTYVITSGAADMLVSGGASFYIGNDVDVLNVIIADDLIIAGDSAMFIQTSSLVQAGDLILGGLGTGQLWVKHSVLKIVGADSQDIGGSISSGYLFLDNDATGELVGTTLVGTSGAFASVEGIITVYWTAQLTTDSLVIGGGPHVDSSGTIDVSGGSLVQTPGSTLIVGGPLGTGTGTLKCSTNGFTDGVTVGPTVINPTGIVFGCVTFTDTVLVDGGELCGSLLSFVPGSTIPIINDGLLGTSTCDSINVVDGVTFHLQSGSDLSLNGLAIGSDPGTSGTVLLDDSGSVGLLLGAATLDVGNDTGAGGTLSIHNGSQFDTGTGPVTIGLTGLIDVDAASYFGLHGALIVDGGALQNSSGSFSADSGFNWTIQNGGIVDLPSSGPVSIPNGVTWDVNTGGTLNLPANIDLQTGGSLIINAGTVSLSDLNITGGLLNFTSGSLSLGGDFTLDGDMLIGATRSFNVGGTTTILGPDTLTIDGGTLISHALDLDSLATVNYVTGSFSCSGPVQTLGGSLMIIEGGDSSLGDPAANNGFYCNGVLDIRGRTVTLNDADTAMFDSTASVVLGSGASRGVLGTLVAPNGLTLDFGSTVAGTGTIDTPDSPVTPLINNGYIAGSAPDELIALLGHVKGVGSYDNVDFQGSFNPGFSPVAINLGSATYSGTLAIEIGGPTPGADHDQLNHILSAGVANLGGTLEIVLLNGFAPTTGQEFIIMTGTQILGQFDQVIKPGNLEVVYGSNQVIVRGFCAADVTGGDNTVNVTDLLSLLAAWGPCGAPCPPDINSDGNVNVTDLLALLAGWGACS